MTHRRKHYVVYPLGYTTGKAKPRTYFSRGKATKAAYRKGEGAYIMCYVQIHPARGKRWHTSKCVREWEIYRKPTSVMDGVMEVLIDLGYTEITPEMTAGLQEGD